MSGGNTGDAAFFDGVAGEDDAAGNGGAGSKGAGEPAQQDTRDLGGSGGGFTETPAPPKKKRGRPPGSGTRPKPTQDAFGLNGSVDDRDKELLSRVKTTADDIEARHLMLAMSLGLPDLQLERKKVEAQALAWLRFKKHHPGIGLDPKTQSKIDLVVACGLSYFPMLSAIALKMKEAAANKRRPGFPIPPVNPQDRTNTPGERRPSVSGDEIVIASGVPSSGKIDFGS